MFSSKFLILIFLFAFPNGLPSSGNPTFVSAHEDSVEGEEEIDAEEDSEDLGSDDIEPVDEDEESEYSDGTKGPSPDADTTILFVKPSIQQDAPIELPAGKLVEFLVGFNNKGNKDYVLETLDTSFRYAMDFSYYIQNFSAVAYEKSVRPGHETSLFYSFIPSESFSARPFGLVVNLRYRDVEGSRYVDAVFNRTVQIVEVDEGLDGETFFLYVFLAAALILLLVLGQQFLASFGRKSRSAAAKKPALERGTASNGDVDFDWLPNNVLNNKSPKSDRSPRQSPRQRKAKQRAGSDD